MGIRKFINESIRVMNVASRPRRKEFEHIVKITGIGLILVGLCGIIIMVIIGAISQ
ncbi:MAG: protein translocase SEC61 complex subunit gamma [Candidatus Micrarchaeota archaeon]|nr:protein translocase SEC61 complex subunit gamma [Candidatus Micrarchaeota archaeon]